MTRTRVAIVAAWLAAGAWGAAAGGAGCGGSGQDGGPGGASGASGAAGPGGATGGGGASGATGGSAGRGGASGAAGSGVAGNSGRGGASGVAGAGGGGRAGGGAGSGGRAGTSGATGGAGGGGGGAGGGPAGWTLTWSDEFDGAADASPDATKWAYDIGTGSGGWGNNELEYYTDRPSNVSTDGQGHLRDHAAGGVVHGPLVHVGAAQDARQVHADVRSLRDPREDPARAAALAGVLDARRRHRDQRAGRRAARSTSWRTSAATWHVNHGSLHGPGYSGGNPLTRTYTLPTGALADDFHVYAVEWEPNVVRWYVDATLYHTRTTADVPSGGRWVYDHPFFMLLNVAVGGPFPGNPDGTTMLPQTMTVDYVRVYSR